MCKLCKSSCIYIYIYMVIIIIILLLSRGDNNIYANNANGVNERRWERKCGETRGNMNESQTNLERGRHRRKRRRWRGRDTTFFPPSPFPTFLRGHGVRLSRPYIQLRFTLGGPVGSFAETRRTRCVCNRVSDVSRAG